MMASKRDSLRHSCETVELCCGSARLEGSLSPTRATLAAEPIPLIELRNVNVDGHHALKDVTWSLGPGEHWAFVGANGSGKSTLLRVICGSQWIDPEGASAPMSSRGCDAAQ